MNDAKHNVAFIVDTLDSIRRNTPDTKEAFLKDPNAQDATLMRLQVIGEQLIRIREKYPDFYEQHQSDEWHRLIGLRNIISHGYREIDFEIIWEILEHHLADFTAKITTLAN